MSLRTLLCLALLAAVVTAACRSGPPPDAADQTTQALPTPARSLETWLSNKVWLVAQPTDRPLGSMYIFLSDGTLMMTSCVETYRLATWKSEGQGRLVVTEDPGTSYRVNVLEAAERDLRLRFELRSDTFELTLRAAEVPFVCPDLPR